MVAYKHDINDIIIKALAWLPGGWEYGEHLSIATATFTMLFGLIKRTNPTTSKTTLQRHLDKMVSIIF